MLLSIPLPTLDNSRAIGRLIKLHAAVGTRLAQGDALCDVTIDLSAGIARDCPPVTTCRIILQETAWLRKIVPLGEAITTDTPLALLSTDLSVSDKLPERSARTTVVSIMHQDEWWAAIE